MTWLIRVWGAIHLGLGVAYGFRFTLDHMIGSSILALMVFLCGWTVHKLTRLVGRSGKGNAVAATLLDMELLRWSKHDPFTLRDLLNGGIAIFGRTGSGKSSASGYQIGMAVVGHPRTGGLILAASPGDRAFWEDIFRKQGRRGDLLIFDDRGSPFRFNFIDYVIRRGGDTRDVAKAITVIGETLDAASGSGGGRDGERFFIKGEWRVIYNAVGIVRMATGRVSPPDLLEFITSAANDPGQLASDEWKKGFHSQCFEKAHNSPKTQVERHDYDLHRAFWLGEYPVMADKTRSSILAGVMNTLHTFNSGIVRELISSTTNISPEAMDAGKWILIDTPISRCGESGAFLLGGWKYLTQWHTLRRDSSKDNNPLIVHIDEFLNTVNSCDAHFLQECRKYRGCLIVLSQSLAGFYANMNGGNAEAQADALMANFHHQIFHVLGDAKTAAYASALLGKRLETFVGGTTKPDVSMGEELLGMGGYSGSFNMTYSEVLQPSVFLTGLRTGGKANGFLADAYVIRSGEPFSTGENWLRVTFSQR